ncbi:hypothetical protein AB4527_06790 [Vibrio breoganii]
MLKAKLNDTIELIECNNTVDIGGYYQSAINALDDLVGHITWQEQQEKEVVSFTNEQENLDLLEMALYANLCQEGSHSEVLAMVCHALINIELRECLGGGVYVETSPAAIKALHLDKVEDEIDKIVNEHIKILTKSVTDE